MKHDNGRSGGRRLRLLAGIAAAAFVMGAPDAPVRDASHWSLVASAEAQTRVTFGVFFEALAPHGRWVRHPGHGFVWVPRNVGPNWRPYTEGRWIYTAQHGWYWHSREPFGWAVYHYGRWGYHPAYGWFWVPGTRWAPAWVVWRVGGDAIGWAPIAPERRGYAVDFPTRFRPPVAESWVFVEARFVTAPRIAEVAVPIVEIPVFFERAPRVVTVNIENNIVVNRPVEVTQIQEIAVEPVITVQQVVFAGDPGAAPAEVDPGADTITVFGAEVAPETAETAPPEAAETPEEVEIEARLEETLETAPPEADEPSAAALDEADLEADLDEAAPADAPPVDAPPAEAPPVDAPPVEAPPAEAPPAEAPPVAAPPAEAPPVETPPEEAPPAETPPADAPAADTPPVETPPADAAPAETPPVDAPPTEAPPVETPPADAPPVEAPPAETPPADAPPVEAPPADAPPVDAPPADTPPADAPPADEVDPDADPEDPLRRRRD